MSLARVLGLSGAAGGPPLQAGELPGDAEQALHGWASRPSTETASASVGTAPGRSRASTTAPSRPGTTATCASSRPTRQAGRVFAHIRATTGTAVQQTNCHPFRHGRWLWMHNGAIADFPAVKRDLTLAVDPQLFPAHRGVDGLRALLLPRPDVRAPGGPAGGCRPGGRAHRGDGAPPRRRAPDPDDGGHDRRGDHVGVPLLQRGRVTIAVPQRRRRRRCVTSTPTPRAPPAVRGRAARGVRATG